MSIKKSYYCSNYFVSFEVYGLKAKSHTLTSSVNTNTEQADDFGHNS